MSKIILTKTFEIDNDKVSRIPTFFDMHGFKIDENLLNNYRFKRGSSLVAFYRFDIRRCPTTVDVTLIEGEDDKLQVMVTYEVNGKGLKKFSSRDCQKIMSEMESLALFVYSE
ncbi:hypothetical protein ACFLU3_00925 [Chloroflexota bacterium]